jgi:hypothetical protein
MIVEGTEYLRLKVRGLSKQPRILFSLDSVRMPVVPLNIDSHAELKLFNDGYDYFNLLRYKVVSIPGVRISLQFLNTTSFGSSNQEATIKLSFKAEKGVTFTTRLSFVDENGQDYGIRVYGTADNCLLTNYWYMMPRVSRESYYIEVETSDGPVRLSENWTQSDLGARFAITREQLEQECDYIARWLNYFALPNPISEFPKSVVDAGGEPIFRLLHFLTGQKTYLPESYQHPLANYRALLVRLRGEGGSTNHISPLHLLGFKAACAESESRGSLYLSQEEHELLGMEAWCTVFYEILKVHYAARFAPKRNHGIPERLFESNVYSPAEVAILHWLEKCLGEETRIVDFDESLRSGAVLLQVIRKYTSVVREELLGKNEEDGLEQATRLYNLLYGLGL